MYHWYLDGMPSEAYSELPLIVFGDEPDKPLPSVPGDLDNEDNESSPHDKFPLGNPPLSAAPCSSPELFAHPIQSCHTLDVLLERSPPAHFFPCPSTRTSPTSVSADRPQTLKLSF